MKESFTAFPELICIDATYKLLELGFPVYVMVCVDFNGQAKVVAASILVTENAQSIAWMMNTFKQHNEAWKKIHVIMAYKDISDLPNEMVLFNTNTRGHNMKYHTPFSRIDVHKNNFFPAMIRLWNTLPQNIINSNNLRQF